jgi:hypothetical protein
MKSILNLGECYHTLQNLVFSHLLSKNVKNKHIRPIRGKKPKSHPLKAVSNIFKTLLSFHKHSTFIDIVWLF